MFSVIKIHLKHLKLGNLYIRHNHSKKDSYLHIFIDQ